jgi:hypothetical protein
MTASEWQTCTQPERMLAFLGDRASGRKLRHFLVACARRVLPPDPDAAMVEALAAAERFADGALSRHRLGQARAALKAGHVAWAARWAPLYTDHVRSVPAWHATREQVVRAAREGAQCCAWASTRRIHLGGIVMSYPQEEYEAQAGHLRDIFGSPALAQPLRPGEVTATARSLAQAAYDDRILPAGLLDPARLAVLADALEEAGADAELLGHLRGPGPHVRGCWAVDAVLGKE